MDNNKLHDILCESMQLLDEGAVKTNKKPERKLDKYLKKYGYEGDKKSGHITVDGKKIAIDRDVRSKTMKVEVDGQTVHAPRQIMATTAGEDKIYLDKNFTKLKNNKRRDAMLQHEIGHLKHHKSDGSSTTKEHRDAILSAQAKTATIAAYGERDKETEDATKKLLQQTIPDKTKRREDYTPSDKRKIENLKKFKKHENDGTHADAVEFEADTYASMQKNGEHLKRGVREIYKHTLSKKGIDDQYKSAAASQNKTYEEISGEKLDKDERTTVGELKEDSPEKETRKTLAKAAENDKQSRSRALKDKSIDRQVYRETIELASLLCEAAELLVHE